MGGSSAVSVEQYLDTLPAERRQVMERVRELVLARLPDGYSETVSGGMINYVIPLEQYPTTYNGQPLAYLALAAQRNYFALHLHNAYMDPAVAQRLRDGFAAAGLRLDMGKSCLRFRTLDDLPLDLLGDVVAATPPARHIQIYESARAAAAHRRKG